MNKVNYRPKAQVKISDDKYQAFTENKTFSKVRFPNVQPVIDKLRKGYDSYLVLWTSAIILLFGRTGYKLYPPMSENGKKELQLF